ncbi:MAG TPA: 50S ribosomal protein L13 [Gemmataceae bacterium]|nr:50S ribosomal protein L13 [Gemmataceae bacterium]
MPSYMAKIDAEQKPINFEQQWWVIDATDQVVGRLAATVATIVRGKHKPQFTPNQDMGDFVIILNAEKVKFTGKKLEQKTYQTYSHYPGGQKIIPASELMEKHPERILISAIKRMVPRTRLGRVQMAKVKIYKGSQHPHQAQQPKEFKLK